MHEGDCVARMTKAQAKRALYAIDQKAKKIWLEQQPFMPHQDMVAIHKIVAKNLKKLKS